jgi:hypothetical protein
VGTGPPTAGGVRIAYDQEKPPDEPPADHVEDGDNVVAAKLPVDPDTPAATASRVAAGRPFRSAASSAAPAAIPPTGTSAVSRRCRASLRVRRTVPPHPARPGVDSAHSGNRTIRKRLDQSPPNAVANAL